MTTSDDILAAIDAIRGVKPEKPEPEPEPAPPAPLPGSSDRYTKASLLDSFDAFKETAFGQPMEPSVWTEEEVWTAGSSEPVRATGAARPKPSTEQIERLRGASWKKRFEDLGGRVRNRLDPALVRLELTPPWTVTVETEWIVRTQQMLVVITALCPKNYPSIWPDRRIVLEANVNREELEDAVERGRDPDILIADDLARQLGNMRLTYLADRLGQEEASRDWSKWGMRLIKREPLGSCGSLLQMWQCKIEGVEEFVETSLSGMYSEKFYLAGEFSAVEGSPSREDNKKFKTRKEAQDYLTDIYVRKQAQGWEASDD